MIYPPSWPLFTNVIMISGSLSSSKSLLMTSDELANRTSSIFELMGCSSSLSKQDRISCIQNSTIIEPNSLITNSSRWISTNVIRGRALGGINPQFHLVINNIEFNETITEAFENGRFKSDSNVMNGHTKDEGGTYLTGFFKHDMELQMNETAYKSFMDKFFFFLPTYPYISSDAERQVISDAYRPATPSMDHLPGLIQSLGECVYICPTREFSSFYSSYNSSVQVYVYSYDYLLKSTSERDKVFGVYHGSTSKMWNGNSLYAGLKDTDERALTRQVVTYWTNFVKYGNPNVYDENALRKYVSWPQFLAKDNQTAVASGQLLEAYASLLLNNVTMTGDASFRKCEVWKQYTSLPAY
jgi:carboxylesterase type B